VKDQSHNYADSFGLQWKAFAKTQLDSANGTTISRDRFVLITGWSEAQLRGRIVADFGCGMGRFAEIALSMNPQKLFLIDYSDAVWVALDNLHGDERVDAHRESILDLVSIPDESVDYGYCIGVLQHTPDSAKAMEVIFRKIRPGGQLAIWAYQRTWTTYIRRSKHLMRFLVRRLPPSAVLRIMPGWVAFWLPISSFLRRIRLSSLSKLLPVADYTNELPLNRAQIREWAILDTFDNWTPEYDSPVTREDVENCFARSGIAFRLEWNEAVPGIAAVITRM